MFKWIKSFREADSKTKSAIIALIIWVVPSVLAIIFCFARLDFVRSYDTSPKSVEHTTSK